MPRLRVLNRLSFFVFLASSLLAGNCQQNPVEWKRWVAQGEPYSVAVCQGSDPEIYFKNAEAQLLRATGYRQDRILNLKLDWLAKTSKAAWEAGLRNKAKSYAQQALDLAGRDRCVDSPPSPVVKPTDERSGLNTDLSNRAVQDFCELPWTNAFLGADGDAIATSDWILGRLALSKGDVNRAEMFLLQSGKIRAAQQYAQFGPNMTLALELLKRGRSNAVLQFLEEWKRVCVAHQKPKLDTWASAIRAKQVPDFGADLLF